MQLRILYYWPHIFLSDEVFQYISHRVNSGADTQVILATHLFWSDEVFQRLQWVLVQAAIWNHLEARTGIGGVDITENSTSKENWDPGEFDFPEHVQSVPVIWSSDVWPFRPYGQISAGPIC